MLKGMKSVRVEFYVNDWEDFDDCVATVILVKRGKESPKFYPTDDVVTWVHDCEIEEINDDNTL